MIGLLGGLSYHSTVFYYEGLNRRLATLLGGFHSAELLLYSFNFATIVGWQDAKQLPLIEQALTTRGKMLADQGCTKILICSNTMHAFAGPLANILGQRFIPIADAVAAEAKRLCVSKPLLLGTKFTMEKAFYKERLSQQGLSVTVPDSQERKELHRIIYEHLVKGSVEPKFLEFASKMAQKYLAQGCDSVILGCTELRMIFPQAPEGLVLLDSTEAHMNEVMRR